MSDAGGLAAELVWSDYLGADTIVTARIGTQTLMVRVPGRFDTARGMRAGLVWAPEAVHVFEAGDGRRVDDRQAIAMAA